MALIWQLGFGLGPFHPWYPSRWCNSAMMSVVVLIVFGYWLTHQTHLLFLREYLWNHFPYLFLSHPPILSQVAAFSLFFYLSYCQPNFTYTWTQGHGKGRNVE
ncbi:hypothetical protein [Pasteuria penetrans]|uniref:hypothetical protein n=1 Tax=Pasteuria penetrans TaxID=86005 RepID=UPI0011F06C43|nr:hypothetical protein [Pasteuria penetrans]